MASIYRNRNVWLFGLISLGTDLASQMIVPFVPGFLTQLGANKSLIGLIEGIADTTAALMRAVFGRMTDQYGHHKGFIALGYGLSNLSKPFLYLASAPWQVLGIRFLDRLGKAARNPARDALLAASVSETDRGQAFGFNRALDRAGAIGGPLLALLVLHIWPGNIPMVFLWAAVPAILTLLLIPLIRTRQILTRKLDAKTAAPLHNQPFSGFLIANTLFTLGSVSDAFIILRATELGITVYQIPWLWMGYNAVCVVSAQVLGVVSDRVPRRRMILFSYGCFAGVMAGMALASHGWHIWALTAGYGVYYGLSAGVYKAYVADLVPAARRASAFGVFSTFEGLAILPAALMMGALWDTMGSKVAFGLPVACALLAMFFLIGWTRRQQQA
ncbi:MAG: MFS transporter [Bacteroidia bacterium]|nr:MFS transporter [Bacteroidia bacterium]